MRRAWLLLVFSTSAVHAQPPLRNYEERYVPVTWFPADGERGPWPALGSTVDAAALDCTAKGEGGGQPILCHTTDLAAELRASGSPLGRCYKLHQVKLPARGLTTFATTGWNKTSTLLFVRNNTHRTDPVMGRCTETGIDACMSGLRPVIGHTVVRDSYHTVVPPRPDLTDGPFSPVHGSAIWIVPHDGAWPTAPATGTYDVKALIALATGSSPADMRFAAAVDLVTVRLLATDVVGAREALDRATAFAVELTGTAFVAPSVAPATAADADAIANGTEPTSARASMLHAMLGANVFATGADTEHARVLARELRAKLEPSSSASLIFFKGSDPMVYVPEVLGAMTRLVHERWTDPCGGP
ncbi:MAG TPA: hypothetical protein VGM90_30815 [Kofleriaceae bacterium]|jgi:hypothetical protein